MIAKQLRTYTHNKRTKNPPNIINVTSNGNNVAIATDVDSKAVPKSIPVYIEKTSAMVVTKIYSVENLKILPQALAALAVRKTANKACAKFQRPLRRPAMV